jgi:hypothetical protein
LCSLTLCSLFYVSLFAFEFLLYPSVSNERKFLSRFLRWSRLSLLAYSDHLSAITVSIVRATYASFSPTWANGTWTATVALSTTFSDESVSLIFIVS